MSESARRASAFGRFVPIALLLAATGCALRIEPVDFGWPVESVVEVPESGPVDEPRYALSFDASALAKKELGDPAALRGKKLHLIRSADGAYFAVAAGFRHVLVLRPGEGRLVLDRALEISKEPLADPAFNQREPRIELLDGDRRWMLTAKSVSAAPAAGSEQGGSR